MGRAKLIQDDVRFLLFSEVYQRLEEPRARRKAFLLVDATIQCLSRKGFDGVTLEMISREAAVSRPLINHYFKDLEDLLDCAVKYIRLLFQRVVVEQTVKEKDEVQMLASYVRTCFAWIDGFRVHGEVWLSLLHRCSRGKKYRTLNTLAVQTGSQRITTMIQLGIDHGFMNCSEPAVRAKMIQTLITGAMVTYSTEEIEDPKRYVVDVISQCLAIVGAKVS